MIGRTLGVYRIVEQIGMGGMATVYKAYDPNTDRYVALKTIPQHYSQDATFRARFEREARAIARLEHIHILPVFAYGEQEGIAYMAMRYMDTGTLTERMKHGPMPFDEASRIIGQIASALDYAHNRGVIHRDVKPSNVLLDDAGNTYLTDFGIAKIVEGTLDLTGDNILGTPQYMSPEQCRGVKDLTPASDQYSLGVILYEMVTGRTPYQAETPLAVIHMQLMDAPLPPPHSLRRDLPEAAEQVIFKALTREPEQRYPSCGAMASAYAQATEKTPAAATVEHHEPATMVGIQPKVHAPTADHDTAVLPTPRRRTPIWVWALVILLIIGIGSIVSGIIPLGGGQPTQVAQVAAETELPSAEPSETPLPPTDTSAPPTETAVPTLDALAAAQGTNEAEATINAARTALYLDGLTMTATQWTATFTPSPTPEATLTPTATLTASPTDIPPSAILYEEDFEDGLGDEWDVLRGQWQVIDDGTGNMVLVTDRTLSQVVLEGGSDWGNYQMSFRYRFVDVSTSSNFLIWTRRLDEMRYYELVVGLDYYQMWKYVNGTGVTLDDGDHFEGFLSADGWHTVVIGVNGNELNWQVDAETNFDSLDASHSMGTIGFGTYNFGGQVLVDDVRVWSVNEQMTALAPTDTSSPVTIQQSTTTRPIPEAPANAVYLIREDFNDGRVQMEGLSIGSSNWSIITDETGDGVYEVDNRNQGDYAGFSFGSDNWTDYTAAYQVRYLNDDGSIGLQFRYNGDRYYILDLSLGEVYLAYATAGSEWIRLSTRQPFIEANTWYDVRVEVRGNQISIYIDDTLWISESNDTSERGWLLMYASPNTFAQVDNIRVWELAE